MKTTKVKSPKTVAERNALITAALAAAKSKKTPATKVIKVNGVPLVATEVDLPPSVIKAADKRLAKAKVRSVKIGDGYVSTTKPATKGKKLSAIEKAEAAGQPVETLAGQVALDQILRKSSIQSPCQIVWEVASEMAAKGGYTRKQVIEACMAKGVAYYTARTQYQQWKAAGDNDKKNAAKSAK